MEITPTKILFGLVFLLVVFIVLSGGLGLNCQVLDKQECLDIAECTDSAFCQQLLRT